MLCMMARSCYSGIQCSRTGHLQCGTNVVQVGHGTRHYHNKFVRPCPIGDMMEKLETHGEGKVDDRLSRKVGMKSCHLPCHRHGFRCS